MGKIKLSYMGARGACRDFLLSPLMIREAYDKMAL